MTTRTRCPCERRNHTAGCAPVLGYAAPFFDDEPDHGLRDPVILETWARFLQTSLPYTAAAILDIGCGTGALSVDALVCRHLLWALPEPRRVLHRWAEFLKPNGRLILIEGFWNTIDSAKPSGFAADA